MKSPGICHDEIPWNLSRLLGLLLALLRARRHAGGPLASAAACRDQATCLGFFQLITNWMDLYIYIYRWGYIYIYIILYTI